MWAPFVLKDIGLREKVGVSEESLKRWGGLDSDDGAAAASSDDDGDGSDAATVAVRYGC